MLENIAIIDATMIVGVLFAEAVGRGFGIKQGLLLGRWMLIWGLTSLLPFSISSILALASSEVSIFFAGIGFIGFTGWFLVVCLARATAKEMTEHQIVVREEELEGYLKNGWYVVAVLQSGRVVIE
jgi:hypothetical protein